MVIWSAIIVVISGVVSALGYPAHATCLLLTAIWCVLVGREL